MTDKTIKGKDAFFDYLYHILVHDVSYIPTEQDDPVQFEVINSDHCPVGYRGVSVFIKETDLEEYSEEEK